MFPRPASVKPVVLEKGNAFIFAISGTFVLVSISLACLKVPFVRKKLEVDRRDPAFIAMKTRKEDNTLRGIHQLDKIAPSDLKKHLHEIYEKLGGIELKEFLQRMEAGQLDAKKKFEATYFSFTRTGAKIDELEAVSKRPEKVQKEPSKP